MIEAQGGDAAVFDDPAAFHKPGATEIVDAWESGYVAEMDTTALVGQCSVLARDARKPANRSIRTRASSSMRGAVRASKRGQPLATLYATNRICWPSRQRSLSGQSRFPNNPPDAVPLVSRIFTRESAEKYLREKQLSSSSS